MANVNLGIDTAYNASLRKRTQELEQMQIIRLQPQMLGGGPLREYVLPGQSGALPDEIPLETGGAMATPTGSSGTLYHGGRQSAVRKQGFAKALRTYGRAVKPLGKTIKPLKEALVDAAVEALEGGRQNVVRKQGFAKALRTYGRAAKPLGKTIKPLKDALVDAAVEGLQYGAGARKDLPAGSAATKAHMKALRDMQDRAPIFEKGSPEAVAHMAKLRAKRRTKAELDAERAAEREAAGLPPKEKRPPSARALIVKQVMQSEGLSMIDASKYVKANGLYVKQ
jgi:hypothetical protein